MSALARTSHPQWVSSSKRPNHHRRIAFPGTPLRIAMAVGASWRFAASGASGPNESRTSDSADLAEWEIKKGTFFLATLLVHHGALIAELHNCIQLPYVHHGPSCKQALSSCQVTRKSQDLVKVLGLCFRSKEDSTKDQQRLHHAESQILIVIAFASDRLGSRNRCAVWQKLSTTNMTSNCLKAVPMGRIWDGCQDIRAQWKTWRRLSHLCWCHMESEFFSRILLRDFHSLLVDCP